jgi:hypothetical protein
MTLDADRAAIIDTVNRIGLFADLREWAALRRCFADRVLVDYTSRDGGAAVTMDADVLIDGWRKRLGGFTATQHLIGNHDIAVTGDRAVCRSLFHSQHRLDREQWDLDGRYRHELARSNSGWHVTAMQMIGEFERGDRALVDRAVTRVPP